MASPACAQLAGEALARAALVHQSSSHRRTAGRPRPATRGTAAERLRFVQRYEPPCLEGLMPRAAAPTEVSSPLLAAWLTAAVGRSAAGNVAVALKGRHLNSSFLRLLPG